MAAAQTGDRAAYNRLLREVLPVLRSIIGRRIYDAAQVDDVIQDTLLTLHKVRHTFDPALPFLPWLSAIADRRAIDALRISLRVARREVSDPAVLESHVDPYGAEQMRAAAAAADVRTRMNVLPVRQREAIELVKLRDLSLSDAARMSNQSVSTVKSLLFRAMTTLKIQRDAHDE
jgi:RNA polymerase sigma-70 factor (ECF subfamily)